MPTSSFVKTNLPIPFTSGKGLRLTLIFLLSPIIFFGQSLTGLWTGIVSNDSSTVRKDQSFEIALTEYKGKVYGYSRSEFIVNDTLFYIVKRVKGTIENDICEVTDDEIVAYNFRGKLDKGIKVTSIFRRDQNDSTWYLDGTWKTNATKKYYSVTGKINLAEEKDLTASKIFPHLEELKLADGIAFYKDRKEGTPVVKMMKPEKVRTEYSTITPPGIKNSDVAVEPSSPGLQRAEARPVPGETVGEEEEVVITKPQTEIPKTTIKKINETPVAIQPVFSAGEEVSVVTKSTNELPKTTVKKINEEQVVIAPTFSTGEEVSTVTKTSNELPKTAIKKIDEEQVVIAPTFSTGQEASAVTKTTNELPKTQTNTVSAGTVGITPSFPVKNAGIEKAAGNPGPVTTRNNSATTVAPVNKEPVNNSTVAKKNAAQPDKPVSVNTISNSQPKQGDINTVAKINPPATVSPGVDTKKQETGSIDPAPEKKEIKTETAAAVIDEKKLVADIIARSATIAGRKSEFSQVVSFKSDSLVLSLYDNGQIDGDTVSVFMNGEVIMSKQGLKASAIKKTIHIKPGNEDFTLVLFAENLGEFPPNTGLLVVHDGDDVYNLRFSSDFQKNTGIVFRRKK